MIYNARNYMRFLIPVFIILLIISGIVYKNTVLDAEVILIEEEDAPKVEVIEEKPEVTTITVYVCGSVKNVTNVTLPVNSRVEDAIKQAGGVTEKADLNAINMAQKLSDEDMVYVPQKGENIEAGGKSSSVSPSPAKKGKININRASLQELDLLPGIGPSIAQKIVDYRESKGSFKSIEELNNVSGIGDAKFKDIKSLITVD